MGVFEAYEDTHFELMYSRSFGCKNRCREIPGVYTFAAWRLD